MGRVLITNGNRRKALAVVRSLGRRGVEITITDSVRMPVARFSRYCSRCLYYPDPRLNPQAFDDWLLRELRATRYDALIALDEDVIERVLSVRCEVERYTYDKGETIQVARSCGVPCPTTFIARTIDEVLLFAERVGYPLVIKPRKSSGSRGLVVVRSADQVVDAWNLVSSVYPSPLIQEYIPNGGDALGVSLLVNRKQDVVASFVHRRLREYPVAGGPSTLRESTICPALLDQAARLLRKLEWYGVAMVEFKVDPRDGIAKLLEINPRFWGSLALAIYSGIDFPYLLYCLATGRQVPAMLEYEDGKRCRWLIGDALHFLSRYGPVRGCVEFVRSFDRGIGCDEFSSDDPFALVAYLVTLPPRWLLSSAFRAEMTRH
jgi:predicted ATP-grasp superfamily ATP-dependent carboligase